MNFATLKKIREELSIALAGKRFGKIFQLSRNEIAADLRLAESRYLFISVDPGEPRVYLIRRRLKDLEKSAKNPSPFVLQMRKALSGLTMNEVALAQNERVLTLDLAGTNELGEERSASLVIQLTGRSSNLFLLDRGGFIMDSLRQTNGPGQEPGMKYSPPARPETFTADAGNAVIPIEGYADLSEALDAASLQKRSEREFNDLAKGARSKFDREITKRERLLKALDTDLENHGDADTWKRYGDLLLANIGTAKRNGGNVAVIDYFDEHQPAIEICVDENDSITEAAESYFRRYTKARNARLEIEKRVFSTKAELRNLKAGREELEDAIAQNDRERLGEFSAEKTPAASARSKGKVSPVTAVARIFRSSDGFEILVGKKAKDNDHLTFRLAKSLDTWMHAADYPGSHVVIRNPNRKEIPQQTLLEAAQLAAFYSQGKAQPKAAVHYTQKKFVNKPKGAAPGLVSLAGFKTLLVEPKVEAELIR